jgi:molecular chaperone DnaK
MELGTAGMMVMANLRTIGIDLGTTNTVVAEGNASGHSQILRTREGEALIPSIVLFADERTIVGREAQLRGRAQPDRLAACAKRLLGEPFYDERIGGEQIPPEVIQACVLAEAKRQCLGTDTGDCRAVIAVPAHFNETQRHATAMAAEMAGLCLLDLVNEPVAAALAFSEGTPYLSLAEPHGEPVSVLVFDLGGYTFEATVLSVRPGQVTMVATQHDSFLGGHEWDLRLADLLVKPFLTRHGIDPGKEPEHLEHLVQRLGQVKHALGIRSHTSVNLTVAGKSETVKLKREEFEQFAADLVERTGSMCDRVLQQSRLDWSQLQQVLLVGGATRMPMIRQMLRQRLGRAPNDRVSPEEAVARGAAIYAARARHGDIRPPSLQVTSISTHSLGLEEIDEQTGGRVNKILIRKGTPLPASASHRFATSSNHKSIVLTVLEGESSDPGQCLTIGRVFLRDLPADDSGNWRVEVTYQYSASGRLGVDVKVRNANSNVRLETVRPAGVSQAHLVRWRPVVNAQAGFAAYREVCAWERETDSPPPLAVAGLPGAESNGILAFLRRLMPFIVRRSPQPIITENGARSTAASPTKTSRIAPPA